MTNKISKGIVAIVGIKLVILSVLLIQSCKKSTSLLPTNSAKEIQMDQFNSEVSKSLPQIKEFVNNTDIRNKTLENEEQAQKLLAPIVDESVDLIKLYGISESEIKEIFGDLDNNKIAMLGLALYSVENPKDETVASLNLFSTSAYAYKQPDATNCALRAFGIYEIANLVEGQLSKSAVLKLAGKVAGKYAGALGVAWMVADFAGCMNWY